MDEFGAFLAGLTEEERAEVVAERGRRMQEAEDMMSRGKLCLVLDLDHTLLNSAKVRPRVLRQCPCRLEMR